MKKTIEQRQQELDKHVTESYDKLHLEMLGEDPFDEEDDPVTFEGVPVNKLDDHAKLRWVTYEVIEIEKHMQATLAQYNELQERYHTVKGYKAKQEQICSEKLSRAMINANTGMGPTFQEIENRLDCQAGLHVKKEPEPKPANESPELENV